MGLFDKITSSKAGSAATGAAIGALGGPVGAVAGGAIGSLVPKIKEWDPFKIKPVKTSRDMLAADLAKLDDPQKFGMAESERQQMIGSATQADASARQGQVSELGRQALAGQGFQQEAFQEAAQDIAAGGEQVAAQAASSAADLNQRMIDKGVAETRARLDAERERVKQNTQFWLNYGVTGAAGIVASLASGGVIPPNIFSGMAPGARDVTPADYDPEAEAMAQADEALAMGYTGLPT